MRYTIQKWFYVKFSFAYYHLLDNKGSFKNKVNVPDTVANFNFQHSHNNIVFDFGTYV